MLSSLPEQLRLYLSTYFHQPIGDFTYARGGCINSAGVFTLKNGDRYFLKWNSATTYPDMFEKEAQGLDLLRKTDLISIPRVIHCAEVGTHSLLVLEYIEKGITDVNHWRKLGEGLALLHKETQSYFGLSYDNYIGSLEQINTPHDDWPTFYWEERIYPLAKKAVTSGIAPESMLSSLGSLESTFKTLCQTKEPPSLLHGDLWSGNVMAGIDGPSIYDPAVYYGNREVEIAFTKLFGGFHDDFYAAYNHIYPLASDFQDRIDLYQLYPLLVHVLIFGGGYIQSVNSVINRYS